MIYITGDTHGDMNRIVRFCERMETSQEDIMIILGDVGLNYYGDSRDRRNKEKVANLPITLFCIHGNHERRPTTIVEYKLQEWNGGKVWVEEAYPNILFAKDGEIYDIAGMKIVIINGSARKGNTLTAINAFIKGASEKNEIEIIEPDKLNIAPCKGCGVCQCSKGCVDKDDTNPTIDKIAAADMRFFDCWVRLAIEFIYLIPCVKS